MRPIEIEGYAPEVLLALSDKEINELVFVGRPIVFRAGSAEILGEVKQSKDALVIELAQIEGGGEGVLPVLSVMAQRYARKHQLKKIEWVVHALNCANPNLKLKRVMERRGFAIKEVEGYGPAYYLTQSIDSE